MVSDIVYNSVYEMSSMHITHQPISVRTWQTKDILLERIRMDCSRSLSYQGRARPPLRCPPRQAVHKREYVRDKVRQHRQVS